MRRDGPGARRFAASRGRPSPRSDAADADRDRQAEVRAAVFHRDGQRCVLASHVGQIVRDRIVVKVDGELRPVDQITEVPRCYGRLTFGHRRHASAGGAYVSENGITLCVGHNGWCEDEPDAARALGGETPWWLVVREGDPEWEALGRKAQGVR